MKWIKNKNWDYLRSTYDWVADMDDVPQSPLHHAEGNVAIHTQMVLAALETMDEYQQLQEEEQEIVWLAALLHDVEKSSTTTIDEAGNIVSPGHAKKGALTARQILYASCSIPFAAREHIVNLVRYHGLPIWILEKPNPQKALLAASLMLNTRLLAILAKADMIGRICGDKNEMLERIDFFEAYCKEQGCWGIPFPFANAATKFSYFTKENTPDYIPFDNARCKTIVMAGLPGMGKDTYIRKHYKDWPVISLDDIRRKHKLKADDKSASGWVAQQAKEQARVYMRAGVNFVWNATNITEQMRSQLITLLTSYKAEVTIVYIEQPWHLWQAQNKSRTYSVPQQVLDKMLRKLEVPNRSEAHHILYIA